MEAWSISGIYIINLIWTSFRLWRQPLPADCLSIYGCGAQIVLNISQFENWYIFCDTSNDARSWDRCTAPKISYNGNVSVSQEIVIICICRGENQRCFLFVKIYYTFLFFSSMTSRLQVVTKICLDFFEVSTSSESAR